MYKLVYDFIIYLDSRSSQ